MAVVDLEILEPSHEATFVGTIGANVRFKGTVLRGSDPLFFKWYSSLNVPPDPSNVALNQPSDNPLDFTKPLSVGSHTVMFTAKDQLRDDIASQKAAQQIGFTGGPSQQGLERPCVIHVFLATMVLPDPVATTVTLTRNNITLRAKAPVLWSQAHYQAVNRVRYRWRFMPLGNPIGRPVLNLLPQLSELTFNEQELFVQYQGNLQASLGTGIYSLTLRVEDTQNPTQGHEVSKAVVIAS